MRALLIGMAGMILGPACDSNFARDTRGTRHQQKPRRSGVGVFSTQPYAAEAPLNAPRAFSLPLRFSSAA
jgi:hypothetical protein